MAFPGAHPTLPADLIRTPAGEVHSPVMQLQLSIAHRMGTVKTHVATLRGIQHIHNSVIYEELIFFSLPNFASFYFNVILFFILQFYCCIFTPHFLHFCSWKHFVKKNCKVLYKINVLSILEGWVGGQFTFNSNQFWTWIFFYIQTEKRVQNQTIS